MFTLPLFVLSKKSKTLNYLGTVNVAANIPSGYTWDNATATINGSSITNPYYIDIRNGVEIITENGKKYIKTKDYFLSETFTNTNNLDTTAVDSSTGLSVNHKRALWANSTTDGITGKLGQLECAYTVEDNFTVRSTSTNINDLNALKIPEAIESKTKNVLVTGSSYIDGSLVNSIILGSNLLDTQTISIGNSLTSRSNFINSVFYPFTKNPTNIASASYGQNTNEVPSGSIVNQINFSSTSPGIYGLSGKLILSFDLYNSEKFIQQKEVELLSISNTLFNSINVGFSLITENFYSQNIIFKNVQLKTVNGLITQEASAILNSLKLDITAAYINPNNNLVKLQPEITSPIFSLKTDSVLNPPTGLEFSGLGSITFNKVNSSNGIDVYARFSNTKDSVLLEDFTYMGTISGTGSTTQTVFLLENEKISKKSQAQTAKFVQIKLSAKLNTSLNIYEKSSVDRLIIVKQEDPRRKSFAYNLFPNKLKFGKGKTSENFDAAFFGPFLLKSQNQKNYDSGNYAVYGTDGYKEGTIKSEHLKNNKVYYNAVNRLDTNRNYQPTYKPTDAAVTAFNGSSSVIAPSTKHLVLTYDIVTTQGGSGTYTAETIAASNTSTDTKRFVRNKSIETKKSSTTITVLDVNYPPERKTVYVTAQKPGLINTQLPDQNTLLRNQAEFSINKSGKFVDNCASKTEETEGTCTTETITEYAATPVCIKYELFKNGCTKLIIPALDQCDCALVEVLPGKPICPCQEYYEEKYDCEKCVEYEAPTTKEVTTCANGTVATCIPRTYTINNTYLNFKYENFQEQVIEYIPASATSPAKTKVLWSSNYDVEKSADSDLIVGLWSSDQLNKTKIIDINPVVYETEFDIAFIPERITIPAISFDKQSTDSSVQKQFKLHVLIEFLNSLNQVVGTPIIKTFTDSTLYETIVTPPSGISSATKIKFSLVLEPLNITTTIPQTATTLTNKLGIASQSYIIPTEEYLNDVGVDISSKPRLEYLDTSINLGQRKVYQQSQAISLAYDLFSLANISAYSIDSDNFPIVKSNVFFDGVTSIPEGTSVTIEWQGKNAIGDAWGAWKADALNYNSSGELALNKRYVRFRVTLKPENQSTGFGYKSPILDEIKIKFWPYNVPYIEKFLLNLSDAGDNAVLTTLSTTDNSLLSVKITTNGTWPNPVYTTLTPLSIASISNPNNNAKIKISFLNDNARLEFAQTDIFGTDPIAITTTTTTTTSTTTTTTT